MEKEEFWYLTIIRARRTAVIPVLESEESMRKDNDIENY
jgi:hypothetical protein